MALEKVRHRVLFFKEKLRQQDSTSSILLKIATNISIKKAKNKDKLKELFLSLWMVDCWFCNIQMIESYDHDLEEAKIMKLLLNVVFLKKG